jgi:subtilisin family serine protease
MRTSLRLFLVGTLGFAAACQDAAQPTGPADESFQATDAPAGSLVAGQYIVVFRDDVADAPGLAQSLARAHGASPKYTYQHAIKGFAAQLPEAAVEALRRNPNVAYVEQDQVVRAVGTQSPATWGLDRVDQRDTPLNNTYNYGPTGSGVKAYIIDTGILTTHADFGGRASSGLDAVDGGPADDCNGHGTHVAGTVGGTTYGVAKGVQLVAVRVLNCQGSGTNSGVIAGIDWVTSNHTSGPAVANMSLGGGASSALDDAVRRSISDGVVYALAAGNGDFFGRPLDACTQSPARVTQGLTVGSTTSSDNESSFSNYGACVDLLAPGSSITSAWYSGTTATRTISGTSMATPHVAGAAALYLQGQPSASPSAVADALLSNSTANTITLHSRSASGGTPNKFLYTGFMGGGSTEPPPPPPPSGFTLSVTAYKVKGTKTADLSWSGANSTNVDVFRDNVKVATTANDGAHTDNIGSKGGGSYTYRVCEAGTSTCSGNVTVTF